MTQFAQTRDPLTVFPYLLADSHLPLGRITGVINQARNLIRMGDGKVNLSNPLIAQAVADMAAEVRGETP